MTSAVSKRQQARNEKTLQDLLRTVPGNDRCADCTARNPGWASWNLGIFLCMRCAGLHRKLGTHVSKVKSLSMDSWNTDQVENMKKMGNAASNGTYNPSNTKPDIPFDVDEADGAMERYIRAKYEARAFMLGGGGQDRSRRAPTQRASSPTLDSMEDSGPSLPPKKTGKRFGFSFRSASSTFSRDKSSRMDKYTPPLSPALSGSEGRYSPPPPVVNKQSRVFGSNIGNNNSDDNFDAKLKTLREMGFNDNRRNSLVLKSMHGNLDRAVESLIRMPNGGKSDSRALTPVSAASTNTNNIANGINVEKRRGPERVASPSNPFDALDNAPATQQQRAVTTPLPQSHQQNLVAQHTPASYNSFQPQAQSLQDSFSGLSLSQQQPNAYSQHQVTYDPYISNQQMQPQAQAQQQQPQQYYQPPAQAFTAQAMQQMPQSTGYDGNRFLRHTQSQTFASSNPWATQQQQQPLQQQYTPQQATNPWFQQGQYGQNPQTQQQNSYQNQQQQDPFAGQNMQAVQTPVAQGSAVTNGMTSNSFWAQQEHSRPQQAPTPSNPFQSQTPQPVYQAQMQQTQQAQQQHAQQQQQQQQQVFEQQQQYYQPQPQSQSQPQQFQLQQQQPQQPQQQPQQQPWQYQPHQEQPRQYMQPVRHDKSSILALYSQPQQQQQTGGQRSVTMPVTASDGFTGYQTPQNAASNPFAAASGNPAASNQPPSAMFNGSNGANGHASKDSVDFVGLGGGGRHSPDAFRGLSARFV